MSPGLLTYVARYIIVSERQRFALEELKITNHEYKDIENTKQEEERSSAGIIRTFHSVKHVQGRCSRNEIQPLTKIRTNNIYRPKRS